MQKLHHAFSKAVNIVLRNVKNDQLVGWLVKGVNLKVRIGKHSY